MELGKLLETLETLAPLCLAEEWDNVGLLVQPSRARSVERMLCCIDLTDNVISEALEVGAELIFAYHPPIFTGLRRIDPADRTGRLVLRLIESGIAVYSPHTALDATAGGINDWLAAAFGPCSSEAIVPKNINPRSVPIGATAPTGQGRRLVLRTPMPLEEAVGHIKRHLGLSQLRVANSTTRTVTSVALCPGAGGSVVTRVHADLYLTGEMRHHDVLAAAQTGTSVVLTEHTNSERGYLPTLRTRLASLTDAVEVHLSQHDHDPLRIV